jgi:hypothetical protein
MPAEAASRFNNAALQMARFSRYTCRPLSATGLCASVDIAVGINPERGLLRDARLAVMAA